ncbi:MAG: family 20 glycosylhydrolase [Paramuribaculum sp.]|nr:family 20 glycosylhydrolase [Paramuribaculum sp.]
MKKTKLMLLIGFAALNSYAVNPIIPKPLNYTKASGELALKSIDDVMLHIVDTIPGISSPEGYMLKVTPDSAVVSAKSQAGLYYGLVTLKEMADKGNRIPACTVIDEPRFSYRGMMLDISRHFRDKEFIKKQIDAMARLKLNTLHLHLTDAAGWRLEIKRYPRLTEYAAWRKGNTWKEWNENGNKYAESTDPDAVGGFLTQDDAREIVEYAAERHITVIPEIEMPSHSEEVTAAFPDLSCTHDPAGQSDFCVGNEATFEFLENVLNEVMDIFPSEVIHIGGDEAGKQAWKDCELCRKRMEENSLENVDQLQSYLIERIEKYLNSKGRKLLGWDEIMEGGLAPNATVMSWRGTEGGIKAATGGHKAIMSPGGYCYLDGYQDAPYSQPEAIGGYLPLEKVYSYNPVPDTITPEIADYIIGVQGNLWCEYIPTAEHAEYMLYPRMFAIAETAWTADSLKNYGDFRLRAENLAADMKSKGYNVFDITHEIGNKPEAQRPENHLAVGKPVKYNIPWWNRYPAGGTATLTDGKRGGWNYNDQLWQGFLSRGDNRMDVTVDLESIQPIKYVGVEFMQLIGPGVWFPSSVQFLISDNGVDFTPLTTIEHEQKPTDGVSFKEYAWKGIARARYVRVIAKAKEGCQFADEIIIR